MVWKCPPLHLPNWNHLWKWKTDMNKPVAWVLTLPDGTHDWILDGNGCEGYIPLYTHPVKELTDEKEALKFLYDAVIRYENLPPFADTYAVESCEFQLHDAKEKARAILRKAQGK